MNKKIIQRHHIILVIGLLLFLTTIIALVLEFRHKQLLKSEAELKRQIDAMKQNLKQSIKSSVLDEEISSHLRMILTADRTVRRAKDPQNEWKLLVSQVMNGTDNLFEAAKSTIEAAYPNLHKAIMERYNNLTDTEAKVCLLSFSDLSNSEMAELLGLRPNTINQNRSNLRKKLNLKPEKMKEQLRASLSN